MVQVQARAGSTIFGVSGELDLTSSADFERSLAEVAARQTSAIVIDFTECRYIDSTVIGAIVRTKRAMNGRFALVAPKGSTVLRILEILRLVEPLGVVSTLDEALAQRSS